MRGGDNFLGKILENNQKYAVSLLNEFCSTHHKDKKNNIFTAYLFLCQAGIFDDFVIAEILHSIKDESYVYLDKFDNIPEQSVLLNLFSGSGRLITEFIQRGILERFSIIYNLDRSSKMIEFAKKRFEIANMKFICKDIFAIGTTDITYDLAICHCGLRYLDTKCYLKLIDILLELRRSCNSYCVFSEVNESFIIEFSNALKQKNIKFQWEKEKVKIQRNTTLYLSYIYYRTDSRFREVINEISLQKSKSKQDVLKEIAGYKITEMNILFF